MRFDRPSFTASVVALARGLGPDPLAERLLGFPFAHALRGIRSAAQAAGWAPSLLNLVTLGVFDHVVLRTLEIDAAVRQAVSGGVRQLVILGAGLDARAYRMPELADC